MTRRRRDDDDGLDGDAPWRAKDYDQAARPPGAGNDYESAWGDPWGAPGPARGALSTSSGRDDRPGEETGQPWERTSPPWERPGWDGAAPARRRPRDDAHPSGPLPQVSSGPMPRLSHGAGPPPVSGPLPPVPREAWPSDDPGYAGTRRAGDRDDTSYLRTGYTDPGYASAGSRYGRDTGAGYAERSLPGTRFASGEYPRGGGAGGPGYSGGEPDYDDTGYHDSFPSRGGHSRDDYEPGYPGEAGYAAGSGYPGEPGYRGGEYHDEGGYPGADYPPEPGYDPDGYAREDYPGSSGYPGEAGYPGGADDDGYPGDGDAGYQADDDYVPGHDQEPPTHDQYGRPLRDDPDDHEYGDTGGWYDDGAEDQDQAWGDDQYDSGVLPGFSGEAGYQRTRDRAPAASRPRPGGGGPDRPRGGKPKRRGAMRRAAGWIALTVLVVILAVAGGGLYYFWHNYLHPPDYSGTGTGNVTVQITSGETATQVGQQLLNLGVVASVRAFSNAAKASGHGSSLQPGYYRLHKHMAATLAFALLLKPSSRVQLSVLITEGMRLSEIIATLGKATGNTKGYQQAIKNVSALHLPSYAKGNPEGYLFPATYPIQPGTPPIQVLRAMVQRFDQEAQSVNLPAAAAHGKITKSDAIIVASLVQAEGRRPQDLPKIARVIWNRLNIKMKLQLDTTVLYARHSRSADVTVAQTQNTKSPYNTYLHAGLPPGPIDSPGDAAIKAALHPAKGNWTYFLTVNPNTGLTKFTNSFAVFQTYQQQLANYNATHH